MEEWLFKDDSQRGVEMVQEKEEWKSRVQVINSSYEW